ncbi:MAG: MopE-related protein [Myxococcota bacterium]
MTTTLSPRRSVPGHAVVTRFFSALVLVLAGVMGGGNARATTFSSSSLESGDGAANVFSGAAHNVDGDSFAFWRDGEGSSATYRLMKWNGTAWSTVGSFAATSVSGLTGASDDVSLAIDSTGGFHVVFRGYAGSGLSSTRAVWYGYSTAGTSWSFTQLHAASSAQGFSNLDDPMVRLDAGNRPHVVFLVVDASGGSTHSLRHHHHDGTSWQSEVIYSQTGGGTERNEINDFSFDLDLDGKLHVAFQGESVGTGTDGGLWYVTNSSGSWSVPVILAAGAAGSPQAEDVSLAVDGAGKVHIAHRNKDSEQKIFHTSNVSGSFVNHGQLNGSVTGTFNASSLRANTDGDLLLAYHAGSGVIRAAHKFHDSSAWDVDLAFTGNGHTGMFISADLTDAGQATILFDHLPGGGTPGAGNPRELRGATATYSACTPSTEVCDGVDNNCDGATDEGNPGSGEACNTGLQGVCAAGTTACSGGSIWCNQNVQPSTETCDGLDNNCNGTTDEGNPGGGQQCSTGLLGVCSTGTTACSGGSLQCNQNAQPSAEACDGLDNNCNGATDEGNPGGGQQCSTGLLGVCSTGTTACSGGSLQCNQNVQPSAEACDGSDNNCNGATDEGNPGGGQQCSTGLLGVCSAGTTACSGGSIWCNQNVQPGTETCDGLDNNCNGATDEGNPGGGQQCSTGLLGVCSAGTTACTNGSVACNQNVQPSAEACDGLDNNCNGATDDGNPGGGVACVSAYPGVCSAGTTACEEGALACNPDVAPGSQYETGDGQDNDCDGNVDDGVPVILQGPPAVVIVGDLVTLRGRVLPLPVSQPLEFVSDDVVLCSGAVDGEGQATCTWQVTEPGEYNVFARNWENGNALVSATQHTTAYGDATVTEFPQSVYARPNVPVDVAVDVRVDNTNRDPIADEADGDEVEFLVDGEPADLVTASSQGRFEATALVFSSTGSYALDALYSGQLHDYAPSAASTTVVVDGDFPVVSVPPNIVVEANSAAGMVVTWSPATATDATSGVASLTCSATSGSVFAVTSGPVTVTCTATDRAGNQGSASFTVWVRDTTAPTLTVPGPIVVEPTSTAGAVVSFSVGATDTVDPAPAVGCDRASGATYPLGTTTVTCTTSDAQGNTSVRSFTITVRDTRPPLVRITIAKTVRAPSPSGVVLNFTASATDLADGNLVPVCTPASGSLFPVGSTTVTCRATDSSGNMGSASALVRVTYP